jgi:spermidine synthase
MNPWILLDSAAVPGGGELRLYRHGDDFSIRVGADELMNSHAHGSEDALARLACERLGPRPRAQVLVGGLGMGFTAAAALRALAGDARVVVAELVEAVVAWNRGPLAELAGRVLDDPRVEVRVGDVADQLRAARAAWDLVLLDVDNGPQGLTAEANSWLYGAPGLARIRTALRPGGLLGVWSAVPDERFTRRLQQAGFQVEVVPARAHGRRGTRHVLWFARSGGRL